MFFDLETPSCPLQFEADVCVIGAGPAGITIAQQLLGSGLRVCLAEGGGWQEEPTSQELYDGSCIGHPMDLTQGRHRVFGGSATQWGGRCAVLDPIDFEERHWVPHSGWPIGMETLGPYYERAKRVSNFEDPWVDDTTASTLIGHSIDPGSDQIVPYIWRGASRDMPITWRSYVAMGFLPSFDWARAYRSDLVNDRNTFVVLHANLISMQDNAGSDAIESALFRSLNGNTLTIRARAFVVCCSGIENARIALNLPEQLAEKLNRHGNVGRFFAQHPRGSILDVKTSRAQALRLQKTFSIFSRPPRFPVQYERGLALSDSAQRTHHILNASAAFYYFPSENSAWAAGRRLRDALRSRKLSRSMVVDALALLQDSRATAAAAFKKYISAFQIILPDPKVEVHIDLEQAPNPESRIRLRDDRDALGVRRIEVDWRISDLERKTARIFAEEIAGMLERLNLGAPKLADWLYGSDQIREEDLRGNYHFIGATRMAKHEEHGVVDQNCRAFGISNLFFAGASVFPTGGHANPTLTIVALAVRVADTLRTELSPAQVG